MNETKQIYILDTSAILTYIEDEDGSDYVENLLIDAEKGIVNIYVSFISLTEVFYITLREKDEPMAVERTKLMQSL
ncbi:MAG: PIN domain-containing protein, partial [Nitrospira sp.]|nr:PIN domain-containing protein [Nitrospira sp.]